ncbi:MAG: hypothetical protein LBD07_01675 [Spirochaetaceae bacterium]|jgi:hypothetical protein|nr:hypothetical protein [Spirochaetaceae bacterium]
MAKRIFLSVMSAGVLILAGCNGAGSVKEAALAGTVWTEVEYVDGKPDESATDIIKFYEDKQYILPKWDNERSGVWFMDGDTLKMIDGLNYTEAKFVNDDLIKGVTIWRNDAYEFELRKNKGETSQRKAPSPELLGTSWLLWEYAADGDHPTEATDKFTFNSGGVLALQILEGTHTWKQDHNTVEVSVDGGDYTGVFRVLNDKLLQGYLKDKKGGYFKANLEKN